MDGYFAAFDTENKTTTKHWRIYIVCYVVRWILCNNHLKHLSSTKLCGVRMITTTEYGPLATTYCSTNNKTKHNGDLEYEL